MKDHTVLTIGPIYCDLLLEGFSGLPQPGEEVFLDSYTLSAGGNAIVAIALAKLGLDSALVASVGDDALGNQLIQLLRMEHVDTAEVISMEGEKTNLSLIMHGKTDRSFLTWVQNRCLLEQSLACQLQAMTEQSFRHVHICFEYLALACVQRFIAVQREKGASISTGLGYQDSLQWNEENKHQARLVDWVFMNLDEAKCITGKKDLYPIMQELQAFVPIPVITLGADGCCALTKEGDLLHSPAFEVTVVNTTGSGDSFAAGFIYALVHNASLQRCMQYGSYLGSLTASAKESVSPLITGDCMEAFRE
ncbi:MAG: carbohydrate kinase family protein [Sphaerochaeta sp.]|nr:carbohydrate kinase family protein [Sphaerochaeta sp.]